MLLWKPDNKDDSEDLNNAISNDMTSTYTCSLGKTSQTFESEKVLIQILPMIASLKFNQLGLYNV
jgi:hypothetical protein